MNGASISLCTTVTNAQSGNLQCSTVTNAIGGVAQKLKVGGKGVLLENITGQTNGTVGGAPQSWSVQNAGQTKLKAI
jgi:hypothetical protein